MFLPLNRRDLIRLIAVCAFVFALGLCVCRLWSAAAWQTPSVFTFDSLETFARLKIMNEDGLSALYGHPIHRLGAPWEANWAAYPMPDAPVFWTFGQLVSLVGLVPSGYLMLLFAFASAGGAFFLCARILGHRPIFAATFAVLFGLSFFNIHRGLSHFSFTLSFVVPLAITVALLVGGAGRLLDSWRWRGFCLGVAAIIGTANPYYGFLFSQLVVFALLYQFATTRRRGNMVTGLLSLTVFGIVLVLANITSLLAIVKGQPTLLVRNYAGSEIYGLRPIELFIPHYGHRWLQASEVGQVYASRTMLKGELFSPYLGVIGLLGLALLVFIFSRSLLRQKASLRPAGLPLILWILAFSIVGGVGSMFALGVTDMFRATNRYSIFILALCLFALSSLATRWSRRFIPGLSAALCLAVLALGLVDQVPLPAESQATANLAAKIARDQNLGTFLDEALPRDTMIFQLPAVPFLEQPKVGGMTDYEHFRPFLHSRYSRFSYGLLANSRAYLWQRALDRDTPAELEKDLEQAGFGALSINKNAYKDRGESFRRYFKENGKDPFYEDIDHLVFRLHPVQNPALPDLNQPELYDSWDGTLVTRSGPAVLLGDGWYDLEKDEQRSWRWAKSKANLVLWNPQAVSRDVELSFSLSALSKGGLMMQFNQSPLWRSVALTQSPSPVTFTVRLEPGVNFLAIDFLGRPMRPSLSDARPLGFCVTNMKVAYLRDR